MGIICKWKRPHKSISRQLQHAQFHRDGNTRECGASRSIGLYRPQAERQGKIVYQRVETERVILDLRSEIVQVVTSLLLRIKREVTQKFARGAGGIHTAL